MIINRFNKATARERWIYLTVNFFRAVRDKLQ